MIAIHGRTRKSGNPTPARLAVFPRADTAGSAGQAGRIYLKESRAAGAINFLYASLRRGFQGVAATGTRAKIKPRGFSPGGVFEKNRRFGGLRDQETTSQKLVHRVNSNGQESAVDRLVAAAGTKETLPRF